MRWRRAGCSATQAWREHRLSTAGYDPRRQLHDVGDLHLGQPQELELVYSQHYCSACHQYFSVDVSDLAPPGGHYTHRVMALAMRSVVEDGLAYRPASWRLWRDYRVFVPFATIQNWVEAGGEKGS